MSTHQGFDMLMSLERQSSNDSIVNNSTLALEKEVKHLQNQINSLKRHRDELKEKLKRQDEMSRTSRVMSSDILTYLSTAYRFCGVSIEELSEDTLLARFDAMYKNKLISSFSLALNISSYPPKVSGHNLPNFMPISSMMESCNDMNQLKKVLKNLSMIISAYVCRTEELKKLKELCSSAVYAEAVEVEASDSGMFVQIRTTIKGSASNSFVADLMLSYRIDDVFPSDIKTSIINGKAMDAQFKTITKRSNYFKNCLLSDAFVKLFKKS